MFSWRSCRLKDEPLGQEADDANNLILWKCKSDRPELRMIEPKKNASRWRCPDGPPCVGSNADWHVLALETRAWLALHHLASCITKLIHQEFKLIEGERNRMPDLPHGYELNRHGFAVVSNSDPNPCIRHDRAPIMWLS